MLRHSEVSSLFIGYCIDFYNKIPDNEQNLLDEKFKARVKNLLIRKKRLL